MTNIPQAPPDPTAGCPLGDRFAGWRIVVEVLYNPDGFARLYGSLTYGAGIYGDAPGAGQIRWVDVTEPSYSVTITRGTYDGGPVVDVDQLVVEMTDPTGAWVDFVDPPPGDRPAVGDLIRVGVVDDNTATYHPLCTAVLESITAEHRHPPRLVRLEAFGVVGDLAHTVVDWHPPNRRPAHTRIANLFQRSFWRWDDPVLPAANPTLLAGVDVPFDVLGRDEADLTAMSAGWSMDAAPNGIVRFRPWPLEATAGDPLLVTDCSDNVDDGAADYLTTAAPIDSDDIVNRLFAVTTGTDWPSIVPNPADVGVPPVGATLLDAANDIWWEFTDDPADLVTQPDVIAAGYADGNRTGPDWQGWKIITPPPTYSAVVVSPLERFVADRAALINDVIASNVNGYRREAIDYESVAQYGRLTELFGFPMFGLYAQTAAMDDLVDRVRDRHGELVQRVAAVDADTLVDPGWLQVLADVDSGDPVQVWRTALPTVLAYDAVVVGVEHRIEPDRWRATISTLTTGAI